MTIPSLRQRSGKALFALMAIALLPLNAIGQQVSIRVEGDGALRLLKDGKNVYAKSATLTAVKGMLTAVTGEPIVPMVRIPFGATAISVTLDGTVKATVAGATSDCGSLVLAMVSAPADGKMIEFAPKAALGNPGEGAFGVIRSGGKGSAVAAPAPKTPASTGHLGSTLEISFAPTADISTALVTVASIGTVIAPTQEEKEKIEAITLGSAPIYGTERILLPEYVRARIKQAMPNTTISLQIPAEIRVKRKTGNFDMEKLVSDARELVLKETGISEGLLDPDAVQKVVVPETGVTVDYSKPVVRGAQVLITATVMVNGNPRTTRYMAFKFASVATGQQVTVVWKSKGVTVKQTAVNKTPNAYVGQEGVEIETPDGQRYTGIMRAGRIVEITL